MWERHARGLTLSLWLSMLVAGAMPVAAHAQTLGCVMGATCTPVTPRACDATCVSCIDISRGAGVQSVCADGCEAFCSTTSVSCPTAIRVAPSIFVTPFGIDAGTLADGGAARFDAGRSFDDWTVPLVSREPGTCSYSMCGRVIDLATDADDPCLAPLSSTASTVAQRIQRGDCDRDGIPNILEWRNEGGRNYACADPDEVPVVVFGNSPSGGGRFETRRLSAACAACSGPHCPGCATTDAPASVCGDGFCVDAGVWLPICNPFTQGDGNRCYRSDMTCAAWPSGLLGVSPPGVCVPSFAANIPCLLTNLFDCLDPNPDELNGLDQSFVGITELMTNGDCDRDGVSNVDEVRAAGGAGNLACVEDLPAWVARYDAAGRATVSIESLTSTRVAAEMDSGPSIPLCPVAGTSPYPLTVDTGERNALCAPADARVLAIARRPLLPLDRWSSIGCFIVRLDHRDSGGPYDGGMPGTDVCVPGINASSRVQDSLGCAFEQLNGRGDPLCQPLSCFVEATSSVRNISSNYFLGDCDEDGIPNMTDTSICDPCTGRDAGPVVEIDAGRSTTDAGPMDATVRTLDAGRDGGPRVPRDLLVQGGSTCGCRLASRDDARQLPALPLLMGLALFVRRSRSRSTSRSASRRR